MYNEEGETTWERSLDSNGKVKTGDNSSCPFMYQRQYYDSEIDLAYNRFRYYDPQDGRYISQDPIGLFSGEANLYSYVNDPNGWIDVLGLSSAGYRNVNNTEIHGKGQTTGKGHALLSELLANKLAMTGKFKSIHMHRAYKHALGDSSASGRKPDLIAIDNNGKVHAIEIASKTDMKPAKKLQDLTDRNQIAQNQLPLKNQGEIVIIEKPYTTKNVSVINDFINGI